jgi:hypothetical protein
MVFLSIVIASNITKMTGIYLTIWKYSTGHIITVGDAVGSFLQQPEPATRGMCNMKKSDILAGRRKEESRPWCENSKLMVSVLGGTRIWSTIIIIASFSLTTVALAAATTTERRPMTWGTASKLIVPWTATTFDSRGVMMVAFLSNFLQVCLSLVYFSVNRILTSICLQPNGTITPSSKRVCE